jgi:hypothetical protein
MTGQWFSSGTPVSSTNKTDRHEITWNIVESGVKHHNRNPNVFVYFNKMEDRCGRGL